MLKIYWRFRWFCRRFSVGQPTALVHAAQTQPDQSRLGFSTQPVLLAPPSWWWRRRRLGGRQRRRREAVGGPPSARRRRRQARAGPPAPPARCAKRRWTWSALQGSATTCCICRQWNSYYSFAQILVSFHLNLERTFIWIMAVEIAGLEKRQDRTESRHASTAFHSVLEFLQPWSSIFIALVHAADFRQRKRSRAMIYIY